MVYQNLFKFGNVQLEIRTLKEISEKKLEDIQVIIENFRFELNHNLKNSSANKFNNSQPNIPIFVSREFIDFVEFNLDYAKAFHKYFNPFNLPIHKDLLVIDKIVNSIVKNGEVKIDTSFFRTTYILEIIQNYFAENKINDFLMIFNNLVVAKGDYAWEATFTESKTFANTNIQLFNQSAALVEQKMGELNPFSGETPWEEIVILGPTVSYASFIKDIILKNDKSNLVTIAKKYNVEIIRIDEKGQEQILT